MRSRTKMWGNSLALRIPKPITVQMGITDDSPVVLVLRGRELSIVPVERTRQRLADLLPGVTRHNLHGRRNLHSRMTAGIQERGET